MTEIKDIDHKPQKLSGNSFGYKVQARWVYPNSLEFNGQTFNKDWQNIHFEKAPLGLGVPSASEWDKYYLGPFSLVNYPAAQALRWWFMAAATKALKMCFETRLVMHQVTYSFECEFEEEKDVLDMHYKIPEVLQSPDVRLVNEQTPDNKRKCDRCKVTYHTDKKPGGTKRNIKFRCEMPGCKQTYYEYYCGKNQVRLYDAS